MPKRDSDYVNTVGEPCEGKPQARFDEGRLGRLRLNQSPPLPGLWSQGPWAGVRLFGEALGSEPLGGGARAPRRARSVLLPKRVSYCTRA
jgi:hypothetical protein